MCRVNGDRFVLCGIVSGGNVFCSRSKDDSPAFYTRVSEYWDWIKNVIRDDEECEEGFECVSGCSDIDDLEDLLTPDQFRKISGERACEVMTVDEHKHCCRIKDDRGK